MTTRVDDRLKKFGGRVGQHISLQIGTGVGARVNTLADTENGRSPRHRVVLLPDPTSSPLIGSRRGSADYNSIWDRQNILLQTTFRFDGHFLCGTAYFTSFWEGSIRVSVKAS